MLYDIVSTENTSKFAIFWNTITTQRSFLYSTLYVYLSSNDSMYNSSRLDDTSAPPPIFVGVFEQKAADWFLKRL